MHKSKLPFRYWFITMHLLTATRKIFSAKEIQRQLGHKRYHSIWHMVRELSQSMEKRDDEYIFAGRIELDERYFSTDVQVEEKGKSLKRGRGSQKKSKELVMAESKMVESPQKGQKPRRVGYFKMKVIEGLKSDTINGLVKELANDATEVDTGNSTSYVNLKKYISKHNAQVIPKEKVGEILPWVHTAISNAKRELIDTFHDIKPEFSQNYLDEFCYKFNRRYYGEVMFNRLLVASVTYKNEFRYKHG